MGWNWKSTIEEKGIENLKTKCWSMTQSKYTKLFIIYNIPMENTFDWKAVEALPEKTVEAIEAITWPLKLNEELKATDGQGDLVTIVRTKDVDEVEVIEYIHRSNREEWQGWVVKFTVTV